MSDGNKKYLGDVFINKDNLERQKKLFQSIIDSQQFKYGGDFDAATLQGYTPSDFATAEEGEFAKHAIQAPLYIGKTALENSSNHQYIESDGVLLEQDDDEESVAYRLKTISWYNSLTNNNLTEALISIYHGVQAVQTDLNSALDGKLDEDIYNEFIDEKFSPIENLVNNSTTSFVNTETGETSNGFNADLVNGLRPILITKQGYEDLLNSEDENERAMATYWRNIFIFVEEIPGDYNMPWEYSLTDPYSFRISDEFLQVKNNLSEDWVNVAKLSEFLEGANFDNIIKTYIENSEEFEIGSTSLLNSLQLLSPTSINDDWKNYPFLSSSLHDDFINQLTINQETQYITNVVEDVFKKTDIDINQILKDNEVLTSDGQKRINTLNNELQTQKNNLNTAQSTIQSIQQNINNIQTVDSTQNSDINTIKTQLTNLQNSINTINSNINSIKTQINNKVDKVNGDTGWVEYKPTHYGVQDRWGCNGSYLYYNNKLHTAFMKVDWMYDYKSKNKGKWIEDKEVWYDIGPNYCRPIGNLDIPISPYTLLRFNGNGQMYHKSIYSSNKDIEYNIISPVYPTKWWS